MAASKAPPVTVCALLALALHAVVLWPHALHAGASSPSGGAVAMAVRMMPGEAPQAQPAADVPLEAAAVADKPVAETPALPPAEPAEGVPVFAETPPEIGLPDAALPPAGVQLRAWVSLGADGLPVAVTAGAGDAEAPVAFRKAAERMLMQARFRPRGPEAAHCLLVSFEPEQPAAKLAWLPGLARDASRCLAGRSPRPQDIDIAAPAAG